MCSLVIFRALKTELSKYLSPPAIIIPPMIDGSMRYLILAVFPVVLVSRFAICSFCSSEILLANVMFISCLPLSLSSIVLYAAITFVRSLVSILLTADFIKAMIIL